MIHLRSVDINTKTESRSEFPFDLPLVQQFKELKFDSAVTFLVGENGSGKSTFLEALAAAVDIPTVGGVDLRRDHSLRFARKLARQMKLVWSKNPHRGFFLRAEDFFNFTKLMANKCEEMNEMLREYKGKEGAGWSMARAAMHAQREGIVQRYGEDLDANSHGESFLQLFQSRLVPGGLYLLDEPEAPLSPQRQLAFLSMLKVMVNEQNCQFIISTHSPIIMAFPEACIMSFDEHPLKRVPYDELEHVTLTRDFLNQPEQFLHRL